MPKQPAKKTANPATLIVSNGFVHEAFRAATIHDAWCLERWRVHDPFPVRLSVRLDRRTPFGDKYRAFVKNRRAQFGVYYFTTYQAARAVQIQEARWQRRQAAKQLRHAEKVVRDAIAIPRKAPS